MSPYLPVLHQPPAALSLSKGTVHRRGLLFAPVWTTER